MCHLGVPDNKAVAWTTLRVVEGEVQSNPRVRGPFGLTCRHWALRVAEFELAMLKNQSQLAVCMDFLTYNTG